MSDSNEEVQGEGSSKDTKEDVEVFEVERVLKMRKYKGTTQYLIKWLGYSHEENTWEDADNLSCSKLIDDFHNQQNRKENAKRKSGSQASNRRSSRERRSSKSRKKDNDTISVSSGKSSDDEEQASRTTRRKSGTNDVPSLSNEGEEQSLGDGESEVADITSELMSLPKFDTFEDIKTLEVKLLERTMSDGKHYFIAEVADWINNSSKSQCLISIELAHTALQHLVAKFYEQSLVDNNNDNETNVECGDIADAVVEHTQNGTLDGAEVMVID